MAASPLPACAEPPATLAEARFTQACARQTAGELAAAQAGFEAVLRLQPPPEVVAATCSNLGLVHEAQGRRDLARAAYEAALAACPDHFEATLHLGQWWMGQAPATVDAEANAEAQAEALLQRAARLRPDAPAPWASLGALLSCQHRDADAEACLRRALQLDAQHQGARFNLGNLCLRHGQFDAGWACLEVRDTQQVLSHRVPWPRWLGEPLAGQHLLVIADAGHGDVLQMWRYRQALLAAGAGAVSWMVQAPLIPLLQAQPQAGRLHGLGDPWPADAPPPEVWVPLMSLPWLCAPHVPGGCAPLVPPSVAYLQAPHGGIVTHKAPFTIGLVWHGNPRHENDADRSLPSPACLAGLQHAWPDRPVRFVNLQPTHPVADWPTLAEGPPLRDFGDAARALQGLDLLITVDTAYAHLAGALGVPVWVMLPHWMTDWRWGSLPAPGAHSAWYPGVMRLFQQPRRGDWASVLAAIAQTPLP